ncbi:helix-turn-helix transcriptional regulator [Fictibacillus sp. NRS-1165]|uniref:helix-turn-helix transcriptional regulator n=1 Tax=Fictibacillus sp. NRS-1165 TaxID=3144463 RepID=UPI003D1C6186
MEKERSWLIDMRKQKELTQSDVGNAVGLSKNHICGIEKGKKNPSPEKAYRLGKFFDFEWKKFYEFQEKSDQK